MVWNHSLSGREVRLTEEVNRLTEKRELVRGNVLAAHRERVAVSHTLRLFSALSYLADVSRCPDCLATLQPFPPMTKVLVWCQHCGFVARPMYSQEAQEETLVG